MHCPVEAMLLSPTPSGPVVLLLRIPCCPRSSVRGTRTCHSSGSVPGDGTEAAHPAREHHSATGPGSARTWPPPPCPAHPQGCLEAGLPPGGRSASGRLLPCRFTSSKAHRADGRGRCTSKACPPAGSLPRGFGLSRTHGPQNQLLGLRAVVKLGRQTPAGGHARGWHRDLRGASARASAPSPRCLRLPVLLQSAHF